MHLCVASSLNDVCWTVLDADDRDLIEPAHYQASGPKASPHLLSEPCCLRPSNVNVNHGSSNIIAQTSQLRHYSLAARLKAVARARELPSHAYILLADA